MFSAKFVSLKTNDEINKTIKGIINYICEKINFENIKIISDNSSTELVSGREISANDDQVVVELLIRKHIVIDRTDFEDRSQMDRHIKKIKHFCEQAKSIEELKYLPINMR